MMNMEPELKAAEEVRKLVVELERGLVFALEGMTADQRNTLGHRLLNLATRILERRPAQEK